MARNSEKAQSMLYRFREQQAIEMGVGGRVAGGRRPRVPASVSSLRDCERWRGDVMKEISRKISKIQDSSLTDYEIRDLNDEINQLMREKRGWETQIVNLGGANYKRAQTSMTDDDGKEVPGTRGYKYFGRARELPGVREMFQKGTTEESARNASFQMFRNQGPDYYGDNDEMDGNLAAEEDEAQREEWTKAARAAAEALSVADDTTLPAYPSASVSRPSGEPGEAAKRKSPEPETAEVAEEGSSKKKGRGAKKGKKAAKGGESSEAASAAPPAAQAAQAALAASFMSVFDPASLAAPVLPSKEEMGQILLERRKDALRAEYGV